MTCINKLNGHSRSSSVQSTRLDKVTSKRPLLSSLGSQVQGFLLMDRTSNYFKISKYINKNGCETGEKSEKSLCTMKPLYVSRAFSGVLVFTGSAGEHI